MKKLLKKKQRRKRYLQKKILDSTGPPNMKIIKELIGLEIDIGIIKTCLKEKLKQQGEN